MCRREARWYALIVQGLCDAADGRVARCLQRVDDPREVLSALSGIGLDFGDCISVPNLFASERSRTIRIA
jgi:hypothetical protein